MCAFLEYIFNELFHEERHGVPTDGSSDRQKKQGNNGKKGQYYEYYFGLLGHIGLFEGVNMLILSTTYIESTYEKQKNMSSWNDPHIRTLEIVFMSS